MKDLDRKLRSGIKRHNVPGASIAILRNGRITAKAAAGVVNINTGVKTTTDSVFQIGSITKPITTTLIMQLVDEGLVELDAPVRTYLPDFRVERADVSRSVTIRHFLNHTSGIDGDFFEDTGSGEDAIERLMLKSRMVPNLFEPGQMMSYCNLGFAALGRVIEVIRRKPWDTVLQEYLFEPLGMTHAFSRPEEALKFRSAIGHLDDPKRKGKLMMAPISYLSFGQKAAGATPSMTTTDLLKFAAMHLEGGRAADGKRFLKAGSVRAMQKKQVNLPPHSVDGRSGWGLGWFLMNWQGEKLYGHDGGTIGQYSFLRILPSKNMAVALLTNGGDAIGLSHEIFNLVFGAAAKLSVPETPEASKAQPDLSHYPGIYKNMGYEIHITASKSRLHSRTRSIDLDTWMSKRKLPLAFIDPGTARCDTGDEVIDRAVLHFTEFDEDGKPGFVQTGLRRFRRST